MFSGRIPWELSPNDYSLLLEKKRASGVRILDLTQSNPTQAQLQYPQEIVQALSDPRGLVYEPSPAGLLTARKAAAASHGVPHENVLMTASTSESYSYLFKLVCNPGDRVLVPRPSYPLFEFLATLDCVDIAQYSLRFNAGRWCIDFDSVEEQCNERTRAILLVNPNNPTGSSLTQAEVESLAAVCTRHKLALVSDEVFACYPLDSLIVVDYSAVAQDSLIFRLSGLSKMSGLPQMKAGWMIVEGPEALRTQAIERLEFIADTFLSISTPVQHALPKLLELGALVREQITTRTKANLEWLRSQTKPLPVEGGWYAILRLPKGIEEDVFVLNLLEQHNVLIQPGFFYDFEEDGYLVLSLLTAEDEFREGVSTLLTQIPSTL